MKNFVCCTNVDVVLEKVNEARIFDLCVEVKVRIYLFQGIALLKPSRVDPVRILADGLFAHLFLEVCVLSLDLAYFLELFDGYTFLKSLVLEERIVFVDGVIQGFNVRRIDPVLFRERFESRRESVLLVNGILCAFESLLYGVLHFRVVKVFVFPFDEGFKLCGAFFC